MADKVCDNRCDCEDCAFDAGDCGLPKIWTNFPGAAMPASGLNKTATNATEPIVSAPFGTKAVFVNLSAAFSDPGTYNASNPGQSVVYTIEKAEHDNNQLVQNAVLVST